MGRKYEVKGFNYPFTYYEAGKWTKWLPVAIFWFIVYSIEFHGVTLEKRR